VDVWRQQIRVVERANLRISAMADTYFNGISDSVSA
jgi:hypothetical protein